MHAVAAGMQQARTRCMPAPATNPQSLSQLQPRSQPHPAPARLACSDWWVQAPRTAASRAVLNRVAASWSSVICGKPRVQA